MKLISVGQGKHAIVDSDDYERLAVYRWCLSIHGYARRNVYVKGRGCYRTITMHREILNPEAGLEVDHVNRDRLDNRKSNLRAVTRQQNSANRSLRTVSSQFKGVSWCSRTRCWRAAIGSTGRVKFLGYFDDEGAAARAYDAAAATQWRDYACLNFEVAHV